MITFRPWRAIIQHPDPVCIPVIWNQKSHTYTYWQTTFLLGHIHMGAAAAASTEAATAVLGYSNLSQADLNLSSDTAFVRYGGSWSLLLLIMATLSSPTSSSLHSLSIILSTQTVVLLCSMSLFLLSLIRKKKVYATYPARWSACDIMADIT